MNKAIFLDRDGTINKDHGYVHKKKDFELIPGTINALKLLQQKGYLLFIITNQSGVGKGLYQQQDYNTLMSHLQEILKTNDIMISSVKQCFHHPENNCSCRKPGTKLVEELKEEFDLDLMNSYVIGDKTSDIKLAENIGSKSILVKTGKFGSDKLYPAKPHQIAGDLLEAARIIQNAN